MLLVNFDPFPILESERLLLRRITVNDANEIFRLRSDAETMKYVPRPLARNLDDAKAHISNIEAKIVANEGINWAITIKNDPAFIGIIGHYVLKPDHFRS